MKIVNAPVKQIYQCNKPRVTTALCGMLDDNADDGYTVDITRTARQSFNAPPIAFSTGLQYAPGPFPATNLDLRP